MSGNSVQKDRALSLTHELIGYLNDAERQLSSARNWGILDVLGGGFIVDLIKHSRLRKAQYAMDCVNRTIKDLRQVLGSINVSPDYSMQVGGFASFADFFFDGCIADIYMTSKIMTSLSEVRRLKERALLLKQKLTESI